MAGQGMRARQTKYVAYAIVYILVVLTLAVVANVLANRYNKSYDTTSTKRYTLSDQTAKIVKGINGDSTITYFDQASKFEEGKDLLDRYANLSPRVHIKYVDPDKTPQVAREAGITSYGTSVVEVGAKKEVAKDLTEEAITGAYIRDVKSNTRTICFVTGGGEHRIDDTERNGYSQFKDELGKDNYVSQSIDLLQKAEVPADCTVLVIGGPGSDYLKPEVDGIKTYVENGGRALFLLDPPLRLGPSSVAENEALMGVLDGWGLTPEKDLILDLNPIGQLTGLGPQVALITTYDSHPIVNDMKGTATAFPMSRSITVKGSTEKASIQKLFESSSTSFATENLSSASVKTDDPKNKKGPLTIAIAGTYETGKQDSEGRFVVIGSSSWAANSFFTFNGNSDFAVNTINWLASDEDLISIRPKDQENRPITMTRTQLNWVRLWSQILLPLAVVFTGITVWRKRR